MSLSVSGAPGPPPRVVANRDTIESKSLVLTKVPEPRLLTTNPCNSKDRRASLTELRLTWNCSAMARLGRQASAMLQLTLLDQRVKLLDDVLVQPGGFSGGPMLFCLQVL